MQYIQLFWRAQNVNQLRLLLLANNSFFYQQHTTCTANVLELNVSKTKELVVDFQRTYPWSSAILEFNKWAATGSQESTPETFLFKKCGISRNAMVQFYRAAVESILTYAITVWFGNMSAEDRRQLDKVVRTASRIVGCDLPPLSDIYKARLQKKGLKDLKDLSHLANNLF